MRYNEDVVGIFDDKEVCWEIRRVAVICKWCLCKDGFARRVTEEGT